MSVAASSAYSLGWPLLRSWDPKVLLPYAQLLLSGRKWRGALREGESIQLDGDFIVDANGVTQRRIEATTQPTVRPPINC